MQNVLRILLLTEYFIRFKTSQFVNLLLQNHPERYIGKEGSWILAFNSGDMYSCSSMHLFPAFMSTFSSQWQIFPRGSTFLAASEPKVFVFPVVFFVWHWFLRLSDHYFLLLTLDRQLFYMTHAHTVRTIKVFVNRAVGSKS